MKTLMIAGAMLAAGTVAASAHVTFEVREAPVGTTYRAVVRVPHGCEGAPTNVVRVQIPEGFFGVKPMPKAGWELETVTGPYANAYDNHGTPVTEGVTEIIWSGGDLPDAWYEEFIFRGTLSADLAPGTTLYFPVVQECPEGAAERWIEIPAEGEDGHDLDSPAPGVRLLPAN